MTDQKRNQNPQQDREQQQRSAPDTAEDRGMDRERRNVGGPREGDQLDSR
ncbi:MAG TPA: hypothetical protein VMO26_24205 [Vicinamibacterales bacterium]|nr:hypothetical protein [Vicinamibacterales bacterium]